MNTVLDTSISDAYRHCAAITRRSAKNFYYGLRMLPEPKRSALYSVYAWMRIVDDITDDNDAAIEMRHDQLESIRKTTHQLIEEKNDEPINQHPVWLAFRCTLKQYRLAMKHFDDMLDGQIEDLTHKGYDTHEELRRYCYRVASTVGLICIQIWGYASDEAPDLAIKRGIALQMTNILRDFRHDFDAGRIYLPRDSFQKAGLTPLDLRCWNRPDACADFVRQQAAIASRAYMDSSHLDDYISNDCRPTSRAMTGIYFQLLQQIIDYPKSVVQDAPLRVGTLRKLGIAVQARWAPGLLRRRAAL